MIQIISKNEFQSQTAWTNQKKLNQDEDEWRFETEF